MVVTSIVCVQIIIYRRRKQVGTFEDFFDHHDLDVKDLIAQLPGHVYWKDSNLVSRGCNDHNWRDFGLESLNDFIGKSDYDIFSREIADHLRTADLNVITHGRPLILEEPCDGVIYWSHKVPLRDKQSNIIGLLGVSVDITESKKKLEEVSHAKSDFISNMEHDIRTPLSGICGTMKLLFEKEKDPENKKILHCVGASAEELMNYFDGIIDFSRIESQLTSIRADKFNFADIVNSVADIERVAALNKQINFELSIDSNIPRQLIGDAYRLQRVLINLVSNAIKFTQEGTVWLAVEMKKKDAVNRSVVLEVVVGDTGIGIAEEKKAGIFEKYARILPSNQGLYSGLGLGLSVVRQFVEEMNGDIEVQSQEGEGSRFIMHVPYKVPLLTDIEVEAGVAVRGEEPIC